MTTALLVLAGVLLVVAFVAGIFIGRKSTQTTGEPTPPSANAVSTLDTADAAEQAAQAAEDEAKKKAAEVLHASDADTRSAIDKLRARGRAGE